ncbi:MAG TPA: ADP-ribosyltransferase [Acetivibrio sp.]|nr:ADP-ribosyltransferase [Acetivibrio sp.]
MPFHKWRGRRIKTISFTSTSILRKTSYDKEVQMVILVPKNMKGAGYINEISYNKAMLGIIEGGKRLEEEFEVLLQNQSIYSILEVQKFRDKKIIVLRWEGYDG